MVKIIISFVLINFSVSCTSYQILTKQPLKNEKIKTNGYYIGESNGVFDILVLYKNGIIRYLGSETTNDIEQVNKYIRSLKPSTSKMAKSGWGTYYIKNKEIEYDMYYPRADSPVFTKKGNFINDSTFVIKLISKFDSKKEIKNIDITYRFISFNPKPDSTNNFIK
jgi:hypothetical protein